MTKIPFDSEAKTKFVRIKDKVQIGNEAHGDVLARLTGDAKFANPYLKRADLADLLAKNDGDIDMGVLYESDKKPRVLIMNESIQYQYPATREEIRTPLREKTQKVLSSNFPDYEFVVKN